MTVSRTAAFRHRATPALKSAAKFIIINAITYGPAGLTGWAVKSVARRPLKMLLAVALEPLLSRLANRFARGMK